MTIVPVIGGMAQHECADWTGWTVAPPHAGENSMGDIDSELATALGTSPKRAALWRGSVHESSN